MHVQAAPKQPSLRETRIRLLAAAAIVAAVLLAFANGLTGPFVFDDVAAIAENPTIRDFSRALLPPNDRGLPVTGRPLVNLTLAINYALGGLEPRGYHAVNVALHACAALLLFGIVRRTLAWAETASNACALAAFVALIWAVHPLQTAAVTYTAQRAEVLASGLLLLTLHGFVRALEGNGARAWRAVSIVACFAAMAAKEIAVAAPVIVLCYDRAFAAGSFRAALRQRRAYHAALAASWIFLAALMWQTGGRAGTAGFGLGIPWWQYALTQCGAIVHYLSLALWPAPLVFDYGGTILVANPREAFLQLFAVTGLVAAAAWAMWRRPRLGFLAAVFFGVLAPTSSVVPVADTFFEHRMYLPLAVLVVALALVVRRSSSRATGLVALSFVIGLAALTARRNRDYRSELALWQDTVAKRPDSVRAHYTLGTVLFAAGRPDEAIEQYRAALRLRPDSPEAHNDLGNALVRMGRADEAVTHFEAALAVTPSAEASNNLGNALVRLGRIAEARGRYEEALKLRPDFADAHNNLGNVLAQAGEFAAAAAHYEAALQSRPDLAGAHANLGNIAAQSGRLDEAIGHYEAALHLQPNFADAHFNLATALAQLRRWREAEAHYEAVLKLRPDYPRARENLVTVRALQAGGG
jgi:tetratricopeptide (TPR) repeat protein